MNALAELRKYLAGFSARCRSAGWLGALFHVGVVAQIAEDAEKQQAAAAQHSYTAEQSDREAAKIITQVLADGIVSAAETPLVRRALRLVESSARHGHAASEILSANA